MKFRIIIFISILNSMMMEGHSGRASECKEVEDLKTLPIMKSLPIHQQGPCGVCYSAAASLAYDVLLREAGVSDSKHMTSPVATSIIYTARPDFDNFMKRNLRTSLHHQVGGGGFCKALQDIHKWGSCNALILEGNKEIFPSSESYSVLQALESIIQDARNLQQPPLSCESNKDLFQDISGSFSEDLVMALKKKGFSSMHSLVKGICKNHLKKYPKKISCKNYDMTFHLNKSAAEKVLENLTGAQPRPVGITYCSDVLIKGRNFHRQTLLGLPGPNCVIHLSLIVGARMCSGRRQFLIRNSWGKTFQYHQDWENDHGDVWVDERPLWASSLLLHFYH